MNHFDYRNGVLHAEAVNLIDLADAVGTPFYCYSTATLERHYRVFSEAFASEKAVVCYAMKANSNQSVLRTLAKLGAGADVVSGGELKRALAAGIPPQKILFSGIDKTGAELRAALAENILCINVESEPELELLSRIAGEMGRVARISVRVNPDVDSGSHAKISTGKAENKFGVPLDADLVFDVRMLPNPYYDLKLRPMTGRDGAVIEFLERVGDLDRHRAPRDVDDLGPEDLRELHDLGSALERRGDLEQRQHRQLVGHRSSACRPGSPDRPLPVDDRRAISRLGRSARRT